MRVRLMSWSAWAGNPANGTASCRVCEKTIRGLDFYEAEQLDAKGRRFICAGCVKEQGAEVVKDFGPLAEGPVASHPMSELLPSHTRKIQGMILVAMNAHVRTYHGAEPVSVIPETTTSSPCSSTHTGETVSANANAK